MLRYLGSLSAAGFAATAISYGPARMGFGLFVPEFRAAFSMTTTEVGFVSSLGFFGFFLGLLIAQAMLFRRGPEAPVIAGLLAATVGLAIVAAAQNLAMLAVGVFVAASSAGFAWTPFNDAVHRKVSATERPRALSTISTGTSVGIAAAGAAALVMILTGLTWRHCWSFFAAAGILILVGNWVALHPIEKSSRILPDAPWRAIAQKAAWPLFTIAFAFGATSAIYISFAADRAREAGAEASALTAIAPAVIFICYGLSGLTGLATARVRRLLGLSWLLRVLMGSATLSLALVGMFPESWVGLVLSASLQGAHVMMTSAVLAFWSERLFPLLPSMGFTAALLVAATGSVAGTAIAGIVSDAFGPVTMFLGAAVLPAAAAISLREHHAREQPLVAET